MAEAFTNDDGRLLADIKNSIMDMQQQMQSTYSNLADIKLTGKSHDGSVVITMSATYTFEDIEFNEKALQGGVKEFKWRIREAWKNLSEEIQKTTQSKTMELLQSMQIPDDIKNITMGDAERDEDEGGEGGRGRGGIAAITDGSAA
ncbi:YbaB/EbfC family nucleoid-associated protein [Candidiatus Paracoxiella cheracis]|uniref:YbaB/EbfC family nucleoid-associated protein n=1 Tax=Candidiatus Paracoxiella cheracis TaxID=3405120 RepID=UPI003BF4C003